jgi:arsenate reductase (glutaredoxin)
MCAARREPRLSASLSAVTIWHNPKCATSRKVLTMIRAKGIEPKIVEYLKNPPKTAEIRAAIKEMGIGPRELLRQRGTPYDNLDLDNRKWTDSELIAVMARQPLLIERPVVRTRKGTRLCRPPDRLKEIL